MIEQRHIDYWRQRQREQHYQNQCLSHQAWEDAQRIAVMLKQDFQATCVIVFGSLAKTLLGGCGNWQSNLSSPDFSAGQRAGEDR